MSRAQNGRSHLSIGEVLSLLQDEFPDVTISKIRFLESQGLLDPERTPSGYRKFYDEDIDRLRWILRQQKDHYLPLKVIKDRLDAGEGELPLTTNGTESHGATGAAGAAGAAGAPGAPAKPGRGSVAVTQRMEAGRPVLAKPQAPPPAAGAPPTGAGAPPTGAPRTAAPPPAPSSAARGAERPAPPRPAASSPPRARDQQRPVRPQSAQRRPPSTPAIPAPPDPTRPPLPAVAEAVSLNLEELAEASGLSPRDVRDLERFGLIEARESGGASPSYDADALIVAQTAAGFLQHGIEARHMRTYKVAVDREAGLFEQIVSPVLKQRNPEARTRAARTVTELIRLGEVMRGVLLRRELRDLQGGP